jgi:hypothetical protein
MRIATIRRNTSALEKSLKSAGCGTKGMIVDEITELISRIKKCNKVLQEMIFINDKTKINLAKQSIRVLEEALVQQNCSFEKISIHHSEISSQIMDQSDMAIRKLLLELETGGNVRFEDEQQGDAWINECENLVKLFIKRSVTNDLRRTIQIHRISRLHNRHMKMKFDVRVFNSNYLGKYNKG